MEIKLARNYLGEIINISISANEIFYDDDYEVADYIYDSKGDETK